MIGEWLRASRVSYKTASVRVRQTDPLGFLTYDPAGTSRRSDVDYIYSALWLALVDVEKAFQLVIDQLIPSDANVADRTLLDATDQIRNEQARARSIAELKQDELNRQITMRLQNLFIQELMQPPHADLS